MANKSYDLFTGAEDVDITGRTPDGGTVAGLDVGTWDRVDGSPGAGTFDILAPTMRSGPGGTQGNNVASLTVDLPPDAIAGQWIGVCVYTRDSTARNPSTPTGWEEVHSATGSGKAVLYGRTVDGTEGTTLVISFTGGGAAGCDQLAFSFLVTDNAAAPVGTLGAASTWLSADDLGPVTGLTPAVPDSLILVVAAKQNDFAGVAPQVTATGWSIGGIRETTVGNDAGMVMMWQQQAGGPTAVANVTITDNGAAASAGAGVGFMVELKRAVEPATSCRHRTPTGLSDWNHYVVKDIPGIGGPGLTDYMVEGTFRFYNDDAIFCAVLARHTDEATETGYEFNYVPSSVGDAGNAVVELYHIWAGTYSILRSFSYPDVAFGADVKLRFCVSGPSTSVQFQCWINDVRVIPDDGTLDPLGVFEHTPASGEEITGGWPGACLNGGIDNGRYGTSLGLVAWRAADLCTDTVGDPCEGGPDNPYPWDPPTPEPIPTYLYVMHQGQWRAALVPTPDVASHTVQRFGGHRTAVGAAVMYHGAWRFPYPDIDTIPEPDTPFPPFHDPCYIVPPIDPGPVLPLTGRFFGPSNTPLGALGPLFNGTQKAVGGWYNNDLPYVAGKDCTLVGAQGSSAVLKGPGGTWNLDTFINGTRAKLAPLYSLLLTYTASGHFFGYSMIDDMESSALWKPSGVPTAELATAVATIRSEFPGIRLGARVRPSTSGGDAGLDFYTAQYVAKQDAPFSWGVREYSLARSRGAYVILSINLLHGGDGSSGIRYMNGTIKGQSNNNWECSAAEVYEYYSQMYAGALSVDGTAGWLAGSLGYQYHPAFLARPGMLDAFVAARNELAALPAP